MDREATSPQTLRRPSGGGAVAGIGSDFKTNLNTGVGSYSVPIDLPAGYRGQRPKLGLQYSSGAPQGEFGLGWALPTLSMRRDTRNGFPQYNDDDGFLLGGEPVAAIAEDLYRPLVDTTFQRVRRLEIGWEVTDRQGTRFLLGTTADSQERHPDRAGEDGVLVWLIDRTIDTSGNTTTYSYQRDGNRLYLSRVQYAIFRLDVSYEPRPDILSLRRGGFTQRTSLRATRLAVHKTTLEQTLIRTYDLAYVQDPLASHSLLAGVTLTGFLFEEGEEVEQVPSLQFEYTLFEPARRTLAAFRSAGDDGPPGLSSPTVDIIDLEGFGLPGVIEGTELIHRYWPNRGGGAWGFPVRIREFPQGASLDDERVRFGDMDGDGRADLLVSSGALTGFYPGEAGITWGRLRPYLRNRPTFDARDRHVRLMDANADGRVDAVVAGRNGLLFYEGRGSDGWAEDPTPIPLRRDDPTFPEVNFADSRVRLADMSGDGLTDVVRIFARHLEYWPNLGTARWDNRKVLFLSGGPSRMDPERCHLADINGDGLADVIYVDDDAIYVWVNRQGESMSVAMRVAYPPPAATATVRATDMLGTGTAGLLFGLSQRAGQRDPYRFIDFTGGSKPYMLRRINNGVGKITEIFYGSSTAHRVRDRDQGGDWTTFLPRAVQVVDRIRQTDTITGREATLTYRYHNGHYDGHSQRFGGFGIVDLEEDYGPATMPVRTRNHFHLGFAGEVPEVPSEHALALRGLQFRKEVFGADGTPQSVAPFQLESSEWRVRVVAVAADGREILFPHAVSRSVDRFERTADASRLVTELEHDDFGNVLRETRRGINPDPNLPELVVTIEGSYINNAENWLLGLPVRRTLRAGGKRLDDTRMFYDEQAFGEATEGLLTRRERLGLTNALLQDVFDGIDLPEIATLGYREVESENGETEYWFNEYDVSHDARGNVIRHRDPFGKITRIDYDAAHSLYPIRTTNPVGHVNEAEYHPRLDTISRLTNPNGNVTNYDYTPLGRVRREVQPGDSAALPTVQYEYRSAVQPISTVMIRRRISGEAATRRSVTYYDASGNTIQTRARLDNGRFFVSRPQVCDLRGLVLEVHPSFISDSEDLNFDEGLVVARSYRYLFDAMRRATEVTDPAGQIAHSIFTPNAITFFDTQDNDPASPFSNTPRVQFLDAFGHLVRVEEHTGADPITTSYEYDPIGALTRIVDSSDTELLTQSFDFAERKIRVVHRDAGARRFLYDARGKLVLFVDGAGRRLRYRFDDIGRRLEVIQDEAVIERYTYDAGAGENLVTQLAQVEDTVGTQTFSYDAQARVQSTQRSITDAGDFEYTFTYDSDSRPLRVTYPDGAAVNSTYDALGRTASISGLIDQVDYDEEGRRQRVVYASGLIETRRYEPDLGRLSEHRLFDPLTNEELFHHNFAYDSANNIIAIEDVRAPGEGVDISSRTFEYDALNRLVHAQAGGAATPFDHLHTYDDIGNMTSNPAFRPEPLVHSGARLTGFVGPDGAEEQFLYDENGCMRQRPGMVLVHDPRGLLSRVTRADGTVIHFAYDYAARRLRKRVITNNVARDTFYIGEGLEVRPDGTQLRYVNDEVGSAMLVVRNGVANTILHRDYLGNVVALRDAISGASKSVHYLPFGKHFDPDEDLGEILFASRRLDPETGLYYFRMRYYDPVLGRFISPDPVAIISAEKGRLRPLSLNPYVYALDNPMRFNDVNGLWTFWEGVLTVVLVAAVVVATALTFGAAGVIALGVGALVGGIIGGLTTGSVDGALAGAMLGFSIVATALGGVYLGGLVGGLFGSASIGGSVGAFLGGFAAGIQAAGFVPAIRQNEAYKDLLGYASWFNPWAWPGHALGGLIFIVNGIIYGVAYAVTWGDPPEWADMGVSFEGGAVITEGGAIRPPRAWNFGNFIGINPNDPGVQNPTDRALILRHERGHMLNNYYFGILQVGRLGAEIGGGQDDSFWEQLAESNTNPNVPGLTGDKDERRRQGGRGFGDIPWWTP